MNEKARKPHLLLVEDEMLSAMMVEDHLVDAGYVVSKAAQLDQGTDLAREEEIDFAILDINLDGAVSFPIAAVLSARDIPFMFASAYGSENIPYPYNRRPMVHKPYDCKKLLEMVDRCLQTARSNRDRKASRQTRLFLDAGR